MSHSLNQIQRHILHFILQPRDGREGNRLDEHHSWQRRLYQCWRCCCPGILTIVNFFNKNIINGTRTNAFTFQVAGQAEPGDELPLPETVDKWHYVSLK